MFPVWQSDVLGFNAKDKKVGDGMESWGQCWRRPAEVDAASIS